MRDYGTAQVVVRTARKLVVVRLIALAVVFIAIAGFLWIMLPARYHSWAMAGVIVTGLIVTKGLLRLLLTGKAFVLTDRGIVSNAGSVDFVAWTEIEGATIAQQGAVEGIDLEVNDVDAVLARLSPIRRGMLRSWIAKGGKPGLSAGLADGGAEPLLARIQERIASRQAGRRR